jgi:hypothetical protein
MVMLALIARNSYESSAVANTFLFAFHDQVRVYLRHVQSEGSAIVERTGQPLRIVDGAVPFVVRGNAPIGQHSDLLGLMDIPVDVTAPAPGVYRILESGKIVPSQ